MLRPIYCVLVLLLGVSVARGDAGIISVDSAHDVGTTADRLVSALEQKGMTVFARIDHAAGASKAGMELPATELVVFGNPKVGTPLMKCDRKVAIDLPQKALIWEDGGTVRLSYNSPDYLADRHDLAQCGGVVDKVRKALAAFADAATRP